MKMAQTVGFIVLKNMFAPMSGVASVAELLRRLALKLLAPLCWGLNPMRGSCQLLKEGCWFTPRNNLFLQLWKLTAIYNQIWLKNDVNHLTYVGCTK